LTQTICDHGEVVAKRRMLNYRLPKTATAPFCPSEVEGSVTVPPKASFVRKLALYAGPGLLVSVGYMDPGNWATDIEAGSRYGYALLFVVVASSLAAMLLQCLSASLGIATGRDLAVITRDRYGPHGRFLMWLAAELSIIACDLAEVLGGALAFHLLFGMPLWAGVLVTALDTVLVLGLQGKGFRQVEAIVLVLVASIAACFAGELYFSKPDARAILDGLVPRMQLLFEQPEALYLAIGILGATVMPHNLYLHSSIVQTRKGSNTEASKRERLRWARFDTIVTLAIALCVNAAILILAADTFHGNGHTAVADIEDAHALLTPILGTAAAGVLFAVALLASGQSSTFTGTIAGQVILEGFFKLKIPCWQRRVITRGLALVPALAGVLLLGEHAVGKLLVMSQVVLSLQLPFALWPLIRATADRALMGGLVAHRLTTVLAWGLFAAITAANGWLLLSLVRGN
jgi:manganese transport protein